MDLIEILQKEIADQLGERKTEERFKTQSYAIILNITCYHYIRDGKRRMKFNKQKIKWT